MFYFVTHYTRQIYMPIMQRATFFVSILSSINDAHSNPMLIFMISSNDVILVGA